MLMKFFSEPSLFYRSCFFFFLNCCEATSVHIHSRGNRRNAAFIFFCLFVRYIDRRRKRSYIASRFFIVEIMRLLKPTALFPHEGFKDEKYGAIMFYGHYFAFPLYAHKQALLKILF